jgi:hypothetical protein
MDDVIRVALVENVPAAELAVSMLKQEGIPAMWRKSQAEWGLAGGAGGPVEILVDPRDAPRAHELLTGVA